MKKPSIKFAHNFLKLNDQKTAELVHVKVVSRTELDEEMVIADTQYYENHEVPGNDSPIRGVRFYPVPNGSLLLLTFLGENNRSFTTLRRFKDASWKRYKSQINQVFDIVVEDSDEKEKV